jgi:hypothetical protein
MSHINSSALSDDGKFSTRAIRHFPTNDDIGHTYDPQPRLDGMGLSTYVETSDKGSRRNQQTHNEERIDEVEEEGSGRTSPPGTIGEVHEYMSENIESHVVNRIMKKNRFGNQSVMGPNA